LYEVVSLNLLLQVIRRLRERDEPIRLFGETDYESFQRLKKLEMLEPDVKSVRDYSSL